MANNLMDPCLIMNRRIEQRQEHSITHTEITERRVTQDDPNEMQHYKTEMSGPGAYHGHSNGHPGVEHSPHSSHMSLHSEPVHPGVQLTSQKVIHELSHQHGGSDTQSLDYVSMPLGVYPHAQSYVNYNHHYGPVYGGPVGGYHTDYEHYAGPPSPSERSGPPSPHLPAAAVPPHVTDYLPVACYDEYSGYGGVPVNGGAPYDEEQLHKHVAALSVSGGMRWRDPNLTEVIGFLDNPNSVIKANAAAYLQHLCYMDDPNKQRTRVLGGIPPLVRLLASDSPDVYRNACGALRNLSYGRQNDENKRAIRAAGGVPALVALLERCAEADVRELVTGVVWNLSSCEDLKRAILDDAVSAVVATVVLPHSGWEPNGPGGEPCWSTVFRNASGVLRNVSSAGEYARKRLRDCEGLVDALLHVVRAAIDKANIGNKIVENCVCVLRNLSYRCQEVEDPHYDRNPPPAQSRVSEACSKSDNLGCFGGSKKKRESGAGTNSGSAVVEMKGPSGGGVYAERREVVRGAELLWQPDVVQSYLALLQSCSNPETLEAAAGALQNLSACYWQPSIEIRAAVRKEKGLPILVELLRMEVDRVVCAVATALRNLAIDQRNKELIGKYAMRDLTQKLPSGNAQHDQGTSDDTIAAVLATLNEVIKKNAEFSRSLLESGGVDRLVNITRQRQKYTPRVLKFAGQVLFTMWQHAELRDVYKKHGWKETDFITKTVAARNAAAGPNSPNNTNNTLNRPMASQGGTRYEDRTIKRGAPASGHGHPPPPLEQPALYQRGEDIPMSELGYSEHGVGVGGVAGGQPVASGVRVYPPGGNTQAPTNG